MERLLDLILQELQYQTKLMESLFDKKDEKKIQMHEVSKSMALLKAQFAKQPVLMQGEIGKMMNNLFKTMEGVK